MDHIFNIQMLINKGVSRGSSILEVIWVSLLVWWRYRQLKVKGTGFGSGGFIKSSGSLEDWLQGSLSQKQSVSTKHCCVSHSPLKWAIGHFHCKVSASKRFECQYFILDPQMCSSSSRENLKHRIISNTIHIPFSFKCECLLSRASHIHFES